MYLAHGCAAGRRCQFQGRGPWPAGAALVTIYGRCAEGPGSADPRPWLNPPTRDGGWVIATTAGSAVITRIQSPGC